MNKDERTVAAGELQIHCTLIGDSSLPPLICLHGGGAGASAWSNYNRNVEALAEHAYVVLMDFPGYGRSTKVKPNGPRLKFFADSVLGVMDGLGIAQADFIGNSLGGGTAAMLGLRYSHRVRRLVLMGPAIGMSVLVPFPTEGWRHMAGYFAGEGPTPEKMRAMAEVMVYDASSITDELVQQRYEASCGADVIAAQPGPPSPESPFEQLWMEISQLRHDTLILWGRDDRVVPFDSSLIAFKQMANAELHVFSECGHWVQWEKPAAFNRLVKEFLSR